MAVISMGKLGAVALVLSVAAALGVVLINISADAHTALESCSPCVVGPQCHAGCLVGAVQPSRMQELSMMDKVQQKLAQHAMPASLHDKQQKIEEENKRLLELRSSSSPSELGSVLDEAVKQVVRAEAAEVKLRRQASLSHGENVQKVFEQLSPSDKQLFQLRAKEFELALHEADKSIALAEEVMHPLVKESGEAVSKKPADKASPNWTSDLSNFLSTVVSDGHGKAWGYGNKDKAAPGGAKKAVVQKLPGVITDNWNMNKGALGLKPKGDDPSLPGVKTHGW
eukprot:CAMPEP_0181315870 /NCGR_PEP_ID=MMETSP1101-20121128/15599_1 /TAXON_ID=46948 /ORGANISM="Rhodomonas abbreviata, Strain Caron Lab Isolate" /LENGTH=282 /DNA_ID=CAMNT_0023423093 /DNA_START=7 /DNA_END=855 /DNA_ORIENTATION=-